MPPQYLFCGSNYPSATLFLRLRLDHTHFYSLTIIVDSSVAARPQPVQMVLDCSSVFYMIHRLCANIAAEKKY